MTPDQIISALERNGELAGVVQMSKSEYRGTRKGNTLPWQEAIFSDLHWYEFN